MESTEITSLLDQIDDEVDDLEDSLAPLLKPALTITSSKLPLLDKAKLYVLVTYAIESMLFSYLRLNGIKAREHPVFQELIRVKQYFGKIKSAEMPTDERPVVRLDKQAATRFINAGLNGNDENDSKRAQHRKADSIRPHATSGNSAKTTKSAPNRLSVGSAKSELLNSYLDSAGTVPTEAYNLSKKRKVDTVDESEPASTLSPVTSDLEPPQRKRKHGKEEKKRRKRSQNKGRDESKESITDS